MKKANKILMAAVAILLCLVLISTSILSGVFAKFVHQRAMDASMTFKKLGVTVTMSAETDRTALEAAGATINTEVKNGKSGSITISDLKMRPGVVAPRAVKFEFTGTPQVPVQVKITPTITYDSKVHTTTEAKDSAGNVTATYYNYYVPANTIVQSIANDGTITYMPETYFMPLGFNFSSNSAELDKNLVLSPWMSSSNKDEVNATAISNAITQGIAGENGRFKGSSASTSAPSVNGNVITLGTFAENKAITFNINSGTTLECFCMGFYYPLDWPSATSTDKEKYDKISTYIAEHTDPDCTVTISYTVDIVQV